MATYGYCRVSTPQQNIERQVRNIQSVFSEAVIVREVYTGTKFQGRKELDKILSKIKSNDTIVFDSVSRMSRNADEGVALYKELFNRGVNLVFLKEPQVNTDTYQQELQKQIQPLAGSGDDATDALMKAVVDALNTYVLALAEKQIRLVFEQAEKEVRDLRQRTREGIQTARLNQKQIGQQAGRQLVVKKAIQAKKLISKHSKSFGGSLSDEDCRRLTGVSINTFYKYKRELKAESGCLNND